MANATENSVISRTEHRGTIRFDNLADLHNAVLVFGGEGDQGARQHNIEAFGQSGGGLGAVLFAMASSGAEGSFAQNIVQEIGNLDRFYHGSWDHDGPGPFHKASLTAERHEDGTFTLNINAAYVGNRPEVRLAEQLGAPIGYYHCTIEREYEASEDGRFRIPLADVTSIYKAVGVDIDEESAFAALTTKTEPKDEWDGPELPYAVLSSDNDIQAVVGFARYTAVDSYEERGNPDRDYEYRIEDGFLTGPAREDYKGAYELIRIAVIITPHEGMTFDKAVEQRITQIADVVETTWGGCNVTGSKPRLTPGAMTLG